VLPYPPVRSFHFSQNANRHPPAAKRALTSHRSIQDNYYGQANCPVWELRSSLKREPPYPPDHYLLQQEDLTGDAWTAAVRPIRFRVAEATVG
jgi:hypothetical protein